CRRSRRRTRNHSRPAGGVSAQRRRDAQLSHLGADLSCLTDLGGNWLDIDSDVFRDSAILNDFHRYWSSDTVFHSNPADSFRFDATILDDRNSGFSRQLRCAPILAQEPAGTPFIRRVETAYTVAGRDPSEN